MERTYFEWFGLPKKFRIDSQQLNAAFKAVRSAVHPDRFSSETNIQIQAAENYAACINEAYKVLSCPTQRAAYLCTIEGGVTPELQASKAMPTEFLVLQMEWRERLEELLSITNNETGLSDLLAEACDLQKNLLESIAALLDDEKNITGALPLVCQLMFIDRFIDDLSSRKPATLRL